MSTRLETNSDYFYANAKWSWRFNEEDNALWRKGISVRKKWNAKSLDF